MALDYLTGDEISGKRKDKRKEKKEEKKKKSEKKEKRKEKKGKNGKRVVRFALAPSRGAFITLVTLNLFKLGTKLGKGWMKQGGKEKITEMWVKKFGGDINALKVAISKGAKTSITGDSIGVASEITMASALPIVTLFIPLLRSLIGNDVDSDNLSGGVEAGKEEVNLNPDEYDKGGEDEDSNNTEGSMFSPLGICFKGFLFLTMLQPDLNGVLLFIASLIGTYFVIGLPMALLYNHNRCKWYFDIPKNFFINMLHYGKEKIS